MFYDREAEWLYRTGNYPPERGEVPIDRRLNVLVQLVKDIVDKKGAIETDKLNNFFHAGFIYEYLIDTLHTF